MPKNMLADGHVKCEFYLMCNSMICKNLSILTYSVDKYIITLVVNFIFSS